jgi:predicted nuclease of predicted toxin-antitoxin system
VKPFDFPLLADENIGPDVVAGLRTRGYDVRTAADEQLLGRSDAEVLARATTLHRVVVTHDLGFARPSTETGISFVGIVYIRPGHVSAAYVLEVIDGVASSASDVQPPFVLVAERRDGTIRVRVRIAPPW